MFTIRIAGITAELHHTYPYVESLCRDYLCQTDMPDIKASTTNEEIEAEMALAENGGSPQTAESICLYRKIAEQLYRFDALLMHGAVIGYKGKAYAFIAPSGTGKSTHIRLWKRCIGNEVFPVNGDKPILRLENGVFTAYGTPWAGKEGWQQNIGLPLGGICIVSRGRANSIEKLTPDRSLAKLMRQIYIPPMMPAAISTMELVDKLVANVPVYRLFCDMSEEAVKTSFEAMTGEIYEMKGFTV